jgi:hypothetical protein
MMSRSVILALSFIAAACDKRMEVTQQGAFWSDRPSIALMPEFEAVAAGARSAESVVILEGLPHPMFEQDAFAKEVAAKEIFRLGPGYAFYARPIEVHPEDVEVLRSRCTDAANFRMPTGTALCEGFHADYAVRWRHGDQTIDYVLCFGCEEAELYLGKSKMLEADLLASEFVPLLRKYREQRPEHHRF